jgi:radical SAM superfamily enzyme YgiQ (UPF0313 family)
VTRVALRSSEVVLLSCYELGHQSFSIASAWAQLEREGHRVSAHDASLDALDLPSFAGADLVAISVPMHTALRLGVELAKTLREHNPSAHICLFGLYAWMHAGELLDSVADSVIGGEFESSLTEIATRLASGSPLAGIAGVSLRAGDGCRKIAPPRLERIDWVKPRRAGLPPLDRYAKLLGPARGETRLVGYVEASRGCKHRCRHCPVVPVYDGRFVLVPSAVVLDDIEQQVAAGARHVTFGDPDFFNAPRHAREILRALHAAHPDLTFDLTTKVEHLLRERDFLPELARLGCLFVVSALESLSDRVLSELDKGHTRADILVALDLLRAARIELRPSFVPFTPWATLDDYIELVDFIVDHDLVENVDPIQLAIRLLVPKGSALLWPRTGSRRPAGTAAELAAAGSLVIDAPSWLGPYDSDAVGYRWQHEDARMDRLFEHVTRLVERGQVEGSDQRALIAGVRALTYAAASLPLPPQLPPANERFVPRLSESWFCCAEPSGEQMARLDAGRCRSESSCQRR